MEHPIKFISRRRPNTLKFKINPGLETGANDGHAKLVAFLFHPIFPFVISVQQSLLQATIVNFHFRRWQTFFAQFFCKVAVEVFYLTWWSTTPES
jgi:hypothetical protein